MANTVARIKKAGMHFEILVDLDEAMKFRKGETNSIMAETDEIFKDIKKGDKASSEDLKKAFGTDDTNSIIQKIVKEGEVQTTQEYRSAETEQKFKQIVEFLSKNAIDPQSGNPITNERIKNAINDAHINIKNAPIDSQIPGILEELQKIIPIKLEMKKVKVTIPAIHTGKAYGVISNYKESEEWMNDGSLVATLSIPAGTIMDFYDKLNDVTHGSAVTEDIRE